MTLFSSLFSNFRSLEKNRTRAFEKLEEALDQFINKEQSVAAQVKRIEKFRKERTDAKRKKRREERLAAGDLEGAVISDGQEKDLNIDPAFDTNCETKIERALLSEGDNKATKPNPDKE